MPKSRRTREQKFLSDLRKQRMSVSKSETPVDNTSLLHVHDSQSSVQKAPVRSQFHSIISTSSYAYLSHDLWKTFFLTISVVAIELLLHFWVIK